MALRTVSRTVSRKLLARALFPRPLSAKCAVSFYMRGAAAAAASPSVGPAPAPVMAPASAADADLSGPAVVAALAQLQAMRASNALSDDEFTAAKRKLLGL